MESDNSSQAAGGRARAHKLSPAERKQIAQDAANARWGLEQAEHSGVLKIGAMQFPCSVLSDGTRILTQSDFMEGMGMYYSGWVAKNRPTEQPADMPHFLAFESLRPFVDRHLGDLQSIIVKYKTEKGNIAHGIKAEIIPKIGNNILDSNLGISERCARRDRALRLKKRGKRVEKLNTIHLFEGVNVEALRRSYIRCAWKHLRVVKPKSKKK